MENKNEMIFYFFYNFYNFYRRIVLSIAAFLSDFILFALDFKFTLLFIDILLVKIILFIYYNYSIYYNYLIIMNIIFLNLIKYNIHKIINNLIN